MDSNGDTGLNSKKTEVPPPPQYGFFGHPLGLSTLFFTELWERFSYYGMRAILLYYMYDQVSHGGLGINQSTAIALMSAYGALVYMSSIVGGWVADRLLGSRRSIFYGGVLIMCGHIVLSIPGGVTALFISMALIVLGTGMLKPNISTVVGDLYAKDDLRRDAGFSIYYMGINIGAFIAPYIVGTFGQKVNYHLGFSFAAIGMALGLAVYMFSGRRTLPAVSLSPKNPLTSEERSRVLFQVGGGILFAVILIAVLELTGLLGIKSIVNIITILSLVIPIIYFAVMLSSKKTTAVERSRLRAYIFLFIASIFFWIIDEQGSTVLAAYADHRTDLEIFGFSIPSSWFQSLNPIFTVILSPTFALIWMKLGRRQPNTPRKFAYGLVFAGLSFLILTIPAIVSHSGKVNPFWLVASYFLVIVGAMCLSPVGLSATTKLAPTAFSAQLMSLWMISDSTAQGISAQVVHFYSTNTEAAYFGIVGGVVIVLGIVMYLFAPQIHHYMRGID
ncbi:peptide MFS transporter [Scopulibacillus cellulosilyticus]|uniref:Peptide MFS transporter n=1 Tax=Scopulibacillus cellulosilyticus TaxID=2665665 RepID=A0ABW2Q108_9BACL